MGAQVKNKISGLRKRKMVFVACMLFLPILQYLIFFVYVNISSVVMAFQYRTTVTSVTWGFGNFKKFFFELFNKEEIGRSILNSLWAGGNDLLLLVISLIFSFFFYKKMPGRGVFRIIFFLPNIISIVIYTMCYKYIFDYRFGIADGFVSLFGLTPPDWLAMDSNWQMPLILGYCLWVGTGYNILIMGGAMANLPEDVMEYSRIEGVSYMRELFTIVIPMIWPTVSVAIIGSVTVIFTLFLQVELIAVEGGGTHYQASTIAYMIQRRIKSGNAELEWASCLGFCFTIMATPLIIIVRKITTKVSEVFGF